MAEVSVIIPMYNSETFIVSCIQSVIAQTFTDLEILVIDDGSVDGSCEICRKLGEQDKRIRLIEREHKGVSFARNTGIRSAEGKYLFFLDSDDMIHPQLIEALYKMLEETKADIASESYYCTKETSEYLRATEWKMCSTDEIRSIYLNNGKAIDYFIFSDHEARLYSVGGKMCRSDSLDSIMFDEELTNGEDTLFLYRLITNGADAAVLRHNWYYYRQHSKGADHIFTANACQNRYKVERYICDNEIKCDRIENAKYREHKLLMAIMFWLWKGLDNGDRELIACIKNMAECEEKSELFSWLGSKEKERFCSVFAGHPFYIRMRIQRFWRRWSPGHPRIRRWVWLMRQKNGRRTG